MFKPNHKHTAIMWHRCLTAQRIQHCLRTLRQRRCLASSTNPMQDRVKNDPNQTSILTSNVKTDLDSESFLENFHKRDELNVKIVEVAEQYALCRPVDFPHLKGKIIKNEIATYDVVFDCREYLKEDDIVRAAVMHLLPPDRILFSLKCVRPVLRHDFNPFTIVMFNVPYKVNDRDLKDLLEEKGRGPVLDVDLDGRGADPIKREDIRGLTYITFEHKADALAAIKKWNMTKMPVRIGFKKRMHVRVRAKKAQQQDFRQNLARVIDHDFEEFYKHWTDMPLSRRTEEMLEEDLRALLPIYMQEKTYREGCVTGGYGYMKYLATHAELAIDPLQQGNKDDGSSNSESDEDAVDDDSNNDEPDKDDAGKHS